MIRKALRICFYGLVSLFWCLVATSFLEGIVKNDSTRFWMGVGMWGVFMYFSVRHSLKSGRRFEW